MSTKKKQVNELASLILSVIFLNLFYETETKKIILLFIDL